MGRALTLFVFFGGLTFACKDQDTRIVVAVQSDLAVPTAIDRIRIDAIGATSTNPLFILLTDTSEPGKTRLPVTLSLVPLGAKNATFTVTATGMSDKKEIVSQSARVSFVHGKSMMLSFLLTHACKAIPCPAPILRPYDPKELLLPLDAGTVLDSGGTGGTSNLDGARETSDAIAVDTRLTNVGGKVSETGGANATGGRVDSGVTSTGGTGGAYVMGGMVDAAVASTGGTAGMNVTGGRVDSGVTSTGGTGGTYVTGGAVDAAVVSTGGTAGNGTGGSGTGGLALGGSITGGSGSGGSSGTGGSTIEAKRFRLMWTSDFPPIPVTNSDPDDVQTVIRLILYSNEIDIEGFIAAAGTNKMVANRKNYDPVWNAYEQVYENLKKHDPRYPTPAHMRSITFEGVGSDVIPDLKWGPETSFSESLISKESEASKAIIAAADKVDPRPLWIGVAGGPREVAQAISDVKKTRSAAEYKKFISKLRVFMIFKQDGTHSYIMNEPDLFVIEAKSTLFAFFCSGQTNCNKAWVTENIIQNHGPLGALYPEHGSATEGVQEMDAVAFMHLVSGIRGINNPENPAEPGWGGKYKQSGTKWLDMTGGGDSIVQGREVYQKEFADRADWMVQ